MYTANNTPANHKVQIESLYDLELGAFYELHDKRKDAERVVRMFLVVGLRKSSDTAKTCRLLWDDGGVNMWHVQRGRNWDKCDNIWKLAPAP